MRAPTRDNRCTRIVGSGLEAPRSWRCWHPLPCPAHGGHETFRGLTIHNETVPTVRTRVVVVRDPRYPRAGWGN